MRTTTKIVLISLIALCNIYGCKKEEVGNQEYVQKFIIGRWPLKYNIRTISNSNFGDKRDTLIIYNPIDTLVLEENGKASMRNKNVISTMGYSIDETGDHITFTGTTTTKLKLIFVRNNSLAMGTETSNSNSGKEVKTTVADYFIK